MLTDSDCHEDIFGLNFALSLKYYHDQIDSRKLQIYVSTKQNNMTMLWNQLCF